jgi:hypothetical protein
MANRENKILFLVDASCARCSGVRALNVLNCDLLYNGINEWITPIGPPLQVKCEKDVLRLCFLSGCWFKRGGKKVRLNDLFLRDL